MPVNPIEDVALYLEHKDYSLAIRRTLDLCLDSGNPEYIWKAIKWSRHYHESTTEITIEVSGEFLEEGFSILELLRGSATIELPHQKLVSAVNISHSYTSGNFSLQPVSLALQSGDVIGVVGKNGNGKTTLLRCIAGQLSLNGGTIDYHLLNHPDYYKIKNHVAFIPQRIPQWYGSLKDNLHFSASISGVYGKHNDMMVAFMLERFNLSAYAENTWKEISSGYKTRFEIARVLLQKPRILILDEPLANLDIISQQTILTDLILLAKGRYNPMGILLSSQQLHEVEKVADEVIFIKDGNCISNKVIDRNVSASIVEFETKADRQSILEVFPNESVKLHFNGGAYTLESNGMDAKEIIATLINASIPISYFRDITNSTKRFFE